MRVEICSLNLNLLLTDPPFCGSFPLATDYGLLTVGKQ